MMFHIFLGSTQKPVLVIPRGHTEGVNTIAFSPDGQYFISGSRDRTAIIWDTSGHQIKSFKHELQVKYARFSMDGNSIYTTSSDSRINTARITDDSLRPMYKHGEFIGAVSFYDSKTQMAISNEENGTIEIRGFDGKLIKSLLQAQPVTSLAFSKDGQFLLTGSQDQKLVLWNWMNLSKKVFPLRGILGHSNVVTQVCLSEDGKFALSASKDKTAILWNLDGTILKRIKHNAAIFACDISIRNLIITGSEDGVIKIWGSSQQARELSFQAHALSINAVCFAPDGNSFLTASNDNTICQWDLNGRLIKRYCGHLKPISFTHFINDSSENILSMSNDATASIWNNADYTYHSFKIQHSKNPPLVAIPLESKFFIAGGDRGEFGFWKSNGNPLKLDSKIDSNETLKSLQFRNQVTSIELSPDGRSILTGHLSNGGAQLSDIRGRVLKIYKQPEAIGSAVFSTSGKYIATVGFTENVISVFDTSNSERPIHKFEIPSKVNCLVYLSDSILFTGNKNGLVQMWNVVNGKLLGNYGAPDGEMINALSVSTNQQFLATGNNAGIIRIWNLMDGSSKDWIGHSSKVLSVHFSRVRASESELLISGSVDGTTKIWNRVTGKEVLTLFSIDSLDWAVVTPDGLFDASPGAMELMYYTVGLEVVELDQLKSSFYQPGLLRIKLGHEKLQPVVTTNINSLDLSNKFKAEIIENQINVFFEPNSDGSKKLSLFVGDKEVDSNINPEGLLEVKNLDLLKYSKYFLEDTNYIYLVSYNKDESLHSQAYPLIYKYSSGSKSGSGEINTNEPVSFKGLPDLYALVVGTSKYSGEITKLVFPDKDAESMAQGLKAVGNRLFDHVFLSLLTTASQNADSISNRNNIEKVLKEFAIKAKAKDVLLVYFSGHGSTYAENGKPQFYYLTKDVTTSDLSNQDVRNNFTISSNDLSSWLTAIPARKQVLIFDACHSGEVISALESSARDISPSKIVALDRLKDRSGTFILTGSAADKVSFESSQYGQGLLTYTLLQGMRGLAITEDKRVDVAKLFGHAKDRVPVLAESINRVQIPIISYPKGGGSFDIGLVDTILDIPEVKSKPVFAKSKIQSKSFGDPNKIVAGFSNYFGQFMAQGANAELIYTEYDGYPNAYSIQGNYEVVGNELRLEFKLFKGEDPVSNEVFKVTSPRAPYMDLYEKAFEKIESLIKS